MFRHLFKFYFKVIFVFIRRSTRLKVAIYDLDNTLYDSWPLLAKNYSDSHVCLNAPPFKNIVRLILDSHRNNYHVVFISARQYRFYFLTLRSLSGIFPFRISKNLILVKSPEDKFAYIKKLVSAYDHVEYYDDLSYNHEHGEVKYYTNMIEKIKTLKLIYFDAAYLTQLQKGKH